MAVTISNVYIETFETNVRHLAQQSITKLRAHVREVATTGEKHNWERMEQTAAVEKTTVLTPTPVVETPWSRRVSVAETWHTADATEQEDIVQMLVDPNSNIAVNLASSMKRALDDLIIAAATGDALDGAGTPQSFPAGQTVGDGTAAISLDLVLQVQQKYYDNDVDPDEPKVMVIGPIQQRKLMQLMEVTSNDYQSAKALASGILPNWMGFTWIVSTRLEAPLAGELNCLSFTPRGIGLQINRDISTKVAEDPSVSFAWRIYSMMTMGAVRVEDEHVVLLHIADTV